MVSMLADDKKPLSGAVTDLADSKVRAFMPGLPDCKGQTIKSV